MATNFEETANDSGKKESSTTAKTALGLAIGGLGLAALNGGGGGSCGCGGLLGNLFGGNRNNECCEEQRKGERAQIELNMVNSYFMPTWKEICDLKQEVAVNRAVDSKNLEITGLLFKMADDRTNSAFALASANNNCVFERLNSKIDCDYDRLSSKTDAAFALTGAQTRYEIEKATCNVIKGTPFLSPRQLADPYSAGTNVLLSRHIPQNRGCGCAQTFNECECSW